MNLTNLFGKQVFALYEGEIVGTIVEAIYNAEFNKVVSLKLFDSEELEYEIKFNNIKAMDDCIIIANKNKLALYFGNKQTTPLFKPVIDENAKSYGKIIDCIIDENGNIQYFLTDKNEQLTPNNMYLRNTFVYYSTTKFTTKNLKPKTKKPDLRDIKVNILTFDNKQVKSNFVPSRLQYNPTSLLGKMAKDTLFGINNEIIIKANQIITEKTIDDASKHNRLNQLYFLAV